MAQLGKNSSLEEREILSSQFGFMYLNLNSCIFALNGIADTYRKEGRSRAVSEAVCTTSNAVTPLKSTESLFWQIWHSSY